MGIIAQILFFFFFWFKFSLFCLRKATICCFFVFFGGVVHHGRPFGGSEAPATVLVEAGPSQLSGGRWPRVGSDKACALVDEDGVIPVSRPVSVLRPSMVTKLSEDSSSRAS